YPYPEKPAATPTASIQGLIAFATAYPIAGSIDFHAFGRLVMYPWAYTRQPPEPNAKKIFDQITGPMAASNGYTYGQISKVIYVAKGSSADYFFWKHRSVSLGIEVGDSKSPNPKEFPKYVQEQEESTWLFLENFKLRK
ncbi:MAG: hypothetical protein K2X47_18685, partial [Bdellovibrionales bacterium]|nr:hypothetical protein [Bdellovibrionales bacterium]